MIVNSLPKYHPRVNEVYSSQPNKHHRRCEKDAWLDLCKCSSCMGKRGGDISGRIRRIEASERHVKVLSLYNLGVHKAVIARKVGYSLVHVYRILAKYVPQCVQMAIAEMDRRFKNSALCTFYMKLREEELVTGEKEIYIASRSKGVAAPLVKSPAHWCCGHRQGAPDDAYCPTCGALPPTAPSPTPVEDRVLYTYQPKKPNPGAYSQPDLLDTPKPLTPRWAYPCEA